MSPLLRDDLQVVLAPSQVSMARSARAFTGRGLECRLLAQTSTECSPPAAGSPAWSGALSTLDRQLRALPSARANLHVILSSQFVRYAIVPWQAGLSASEDAVYVRQYFAQMFGTSADSWDICVSATPIGAPRLASAIDAALLLAIRELCARDTVRLQTVRPQLAATFDRYRRSLPASGWIVLAEAGCLCIGLFEQGRWLSVRTTRTGNGDARELPALLAREACLANSAGDAGDVFLWAPDRVVDSPQPEGRFRFHALAASPGVAPRGAVR